jgi:type IV secretory pathway VirB10-like protein
MLLSRSFPAALLAGLILAAGLVAPAAAQWKWRDKNGQITVSDLPPPRDVPAKDVLQRPDPAAAQRDSAASAPAPTARPPVDKELQARKLAAEQEQAARARADAERLDAQKAENCRRARSHLAALDTGQRIARYNDKGEREVLDDKGRAEESRRARDVIASDCR